MDSSDAPLSISTSGGGKLEIHRDAQDILLRISSQDEYDAIRLYDNIKDTLENTGKFVLSVQAVTL